MGKEKRKWSKGNGRQKYVKTGGKMGERKGKGMHMNAAGEQEINGKERSDSAKQ